MSTSEMSRDEITRREAIRRVTALLGGVALVGGDALLAGCRESDGVKQQADAADPGFSADDVAFLDEVADTILPDTSTPGAKAAKVGAFMALMVTDTYSPADRKVFRDGMRAIDDASRKANNATFVAATPAQRLALLETLDREQKAQHDAREASRRADAERRRAATAPSVPDSVKPAPAKSGDAFLPDQRKQNAANAPTADVNPATAITKDSPAHYFRM